MKEYPRISKHTRVNEAIRASELRVIGADGTQIGVLRREEAIARAYEVGLDLVEVSPNANPPVARIVDWGKYNYQKSKQQQKNKKKTVSDLKQIRMGLKIGDHDLDIKLKKIREFLDQGHKVRITAFFRGRELAHKDIGYKLLERVTEKLADTAIVDQEPQLAGKHLSIVVRSNPRAKN
ncbi:translation initiation factor IF-3 [Candidatus Saccharibacteria bacterium CPR2]|nr:translation initiation factor IF-3 [Candidatus Saccharibacteria bacterium CPR2]